MDKQFFDVHAELDVQISNEDIDCIMALALSDGITDWCSQAKVVGGVRLGEYNSDQISRGGALQLYDAEGFERPWVLDRDKFIAGFAKFLGRGGAPCVEGDRIDVCMLDSDSADVIIQYALFGELVFV